jgi:hypothetical protein
MQYRFFILLMSFLFLSCSSLRKAKQLNKNNSFLEQLMQTKPEQFSGILANKDSLNVQIIYTKIDRKKNNSPVFTDYTFNLNKKQYFYPASTVKMPIAFLALEKLNELNIPGVDKYTTMLTDSASDKQQIVYVSPNAEDSRPTIANYIKQIFLVSDNNAFNRLYEFLGQATIQQKLSEKGYNDAVIRHRLQIPLTDSQNRYTNPVSFYDTAGNLLYHQTGEYSKAVFPSFEAKRGKGYYKDNQLINEPFDFSMKNWLDLQDLHDLSKSVLFPESVATKQRFNLKKEDYDFLLHWMSAYPQESKYPFYDTAQYGKTYCKFLLYGSEKTDIPDNIRIFNKVGDAYGFLTDIAYIIDKKNKVEFMLSATISCNSDGIYNDDKYDYDTVGYPFMKQLGQIIYQFELQRKRKQYPDLKKFTINYREN